MNSCKYLEWKFRGTTRLDFLIALICFVLAFTLPESFADKNSPIEYFQMAVVAVGLYMACTAKDYRRLYTFASLCLFFILAREVNYGRTLFIFADPKYVHGYPKWKDLEYGWLAHVCVGLYMAWMVVYFFWKKVWKEFWEVLTTNRFPVIDLLFALSGVTVAMLFESMHDNIREELGETVFYVSLMGILYLFSRKKLTRIP